MSKCRRAAKYEVCLTAEERGFLEAIVSTGRGAAARIRRARILLKTDVSVAGPGWSDARIAEALETGAPTAHRVLRCLVEEGRRYGSLSKPGRCGLRRAVVPNVPKLLWHGN